MSKLELKCIECAAKTKEEALLAGLNQLALSMDEVTIEILQEGKKGFLGVGSRPFILRLTELPKEVESEEEETIMEDVVIIKEDTIEPLFQPYLFGESECAAAEFLYGLLERMDLPTDISFSVHNNTVRLRLRSDYMGILIGHRGETLDALQYLTNLAINNGQNTYTRVYLDMENYRNKREKTLIKLAKKTAQEVISTGEPISLEPMNPYERRIFHASLQDIEGITTYSRGDDPDRYIVVAPE